MIENCCHFGAVPSVLRFQLKSDCALLIYRQEVKHINHLSFLIIPVPISNSLVINIKNVIEQYYIELLYSRGIELYLWFWRYTCWFPIHCMPSFKYTIDSHCLCEQWGVHESEAKADSQQPGKTHWHRGLQQEGVCKGVGYHQTD